MLAKMDWHILGRPFHDMAAAFTVAPLIFPSGKAIQDVAEGS